MTDLVTIVIRSIGRDTLQRAIRSVEAQTYPSLEIVLVDSSGAATLAEPAMTRRDVALRILRPTEKLSYARAANAGLNHATGEYIAFLDDDDYYDPPHVASLREAVKSTDRDGRAHLLAYSATRAVDDSGGELGVMALEFGQLSIFKQNPAQIGAVLFSRKLRDLGCTFDLALDGYEDWDFWLQAAQYTRFALTRQATCNWLATSGGSGSGIGANFDADRHHVYRAAIEDKWKARIAGLVDNFQRHIEQGAARQQAGDYAAAEREYRSAIDLDPRHAPTLNLLAKLFHDMGRLGEADRALAIAIASDSRNPDWRFNRALVLVAGRKYQGALETIRGLLAIDPANTRALRLRSELEGVLRSV